MKLSKVVIATTCKIFCSTGGLGFFLRAAACLCFFTLGFHLVVALPLAPIPGFAITKPKDLTIPAVL